MSDDGVPIWTPTPQAARAARIRDFTAWLAARGAPVGDGYADLWRWSVTDLDGFWDAVREYFGVRFTRPATAVLARERMPGAVWFPGATLNYTDQVFAGSSPAGTAILQAGEDRAVQEWTWAELASQVARLARTLTRLGVRPGDRVAGYLPDVAEAVVAFLACAAVGAVWSCTGQDYAAPGAVHRFAQLEPVVLVVADGYRHGGRDHDRRAASAAVHAGLPTVRATIVVTRLGLPVAAAPGWIPWAEAVADGRTDGRADPVETLPVPFDHPLWVLFSSGTTGMPKGIVHGHGGVVLEHLKSVALHLDLGPADTFLWYTSPSWMMWNYRCAGLLVGATIACYDGSPFHPGPDGLWGLAARLGVTVLGTSPGYLLACAKAGAEPARDHDLGRVRILGVTGSALPAESYVWARDHVGADVQVASISGGTDVVSAFAGEVPTLPVWPGELSAACLGVALDALDERGASVRDTVGELVVTRPMPSMPLRFWNDPDGARYREAYFDVYPGVWRHGDWITITGRGTVVMHGRSDSTLNRNGVRMGSADVYRAVEQVPEVRDALVIGAELPDGGYWMPLYVTLAPGAVLDDALRGRIAAAVREHASPRHVPDEIVEAPGVPYTRTGKKLEVPVKRILQGQDAAGVVDPRVVDDPSVLAWYVAQAAVRTAGRPRAGGPAVEAAGSGRWAGLSPGLATDLAVLEHAGALVEEHGDHLVVRSPHNPGFHWGNCLVVLDEDAVDDAPRWLATFAAAFPAATWVAIDLARMPPDGTRWTAAGLTPEPDDVLVAAELPRRTAPPAGYAVRRLASDADWEAAVDASVRENAHPGGHAAVEYAAFARDQRRSQRAMSERDVAAWFGAFAADGTLAADLGIVCCGTTARYQAVGTEVGHRRRGLASHLLGVAAQWSAGRGCARWVIVAERGSAAGRLYRAAGFAPDRPTVQVYRAPRAPGDGRSLPVPGG